MILPDPVSSPSGSWLTDQSMDMPASLRFRIVGPGDAVVQQHSAGRSLSRMNRNTPDGLPTPICSVRPIDDTASKSPSGTSR